MHFPSDPDKREGIWKKLEHSFSHAENCFVVSGGIFDFGAKYKILDSEKAHDLILKLKSCDYVRVGVSRNTPVLPHFSANFLSNKKARVLEYIGLTSRSDGSLDLNRVKNDFLLIADTMFFDNPDLQEIEFPSEVDVGSTEAYDLELGNNISILKRK